jgi:predicted molibdopterin-dependent oxidoreductase YjgC
VERGAKGPSRRAKDQPSDESGGLIASDTFVEVDWNTALDTVARKLTAEKQAYGGQAFALLASAKCTNEENFLLAKLTRQLMTTNSIDHCARL